MVADSVAKSLTLPTGGDPPQGFDPMVQPDRFTGAAALSVPVPTTPARGVDLALALGYSSARGNGDYGIGFSLDLPAVSRLTNNGVPRYDGSDSFALTGVGALTPATDPATGRPIEQVRVDAGTTWRVRQYLPVDEGSLPLVEQWTDPGTGESHWRVVSRDNTLSVYGSTDRGRLADPDDPRRIYQWLVEESVDANGNRIRFSYKAETGADIREEIYEQGRVRTARRYPERIRYGNHRPPAGAAKRSPRSSGRNPEKVRPDGPEEFAYEVVFDYGEYDLDVDRPRCDPYLPARPWAERADPFSTYAAGFEIRTYRLCRGILMFHALPDAPDTSPCLTRATRFGYREDPSGTLLTSVTVTGYRRGGDGSYETATAPVVELEYSAFDPPAHPDFHRLEVPGAPPMPGYLNRGRFRPVDLDGLGLPGFLLSQAGTALYYRPLGNGRYGPASPLPAAPDTGGLPPEVSVEDLDGDGGLQLLILAGSTAGYFGRHGDSWAAFTPVRAIPTALGSARAELADLDGDGRAELVFVGRDAIEYYPSRGTAGFASARARPRPAGFPSAAGNSAVEVVAFAGAFGDGLAHRVRIRDGEVTVWPSLGHGNFAPGVRLAGAPRLPAGLTAANIHLADLDGTGTVDLVLAFPDRLEFYRNRSGNGFDPPRVLPVPAELDSLDQVSVADVRGTGTAAIVLSRLAPAVTHWYLDLCDSVVPNLLVRTANRTGATCRVRYASTIRYALADQRAGRAWLTRMPYPLPVVAELVATDTVGQTVTTTTFDYHDGYFDPVGRQFQGFGFVESVASHHVDGPAGASSGPVRTRVWHHTGGYAESGALRARARREYFDGDSKAYQMPDCDFDPAILAAGGPTVRQAYRALRGRVLRTEIYGADPVPYQVVESAFTTRLRQPAGPVGNGSFFVEPRETIEYGYERDATDPVVQHRLVLANTLADLDGDSYHEQVATVCYPRRSRHPAVVPEQEQLRVGVEINRYTRAAGDFRQIGQPYESQSLDLGGIAAPAGGYFGLDELRAVAGTALADRIPYGTPFTGTTPQSRMATWRQTRYWNQEQTAALPLGQIAGTALVHHHTEAAFSGAWLTEVFGSRVTAADLEQAGFRAGAEGYWWRPGPVHTYLDRAGFHLPIREDSQPGPGPFLLTAGSYDEHLLFQVSATVYADERTPLTQTAEVDYQAAGPWQVTDANRVVRQVRYDPLGAVLATSIRKGEVGDGDLRDYVPRSGATVASVLADKPYYLQQAAAYYFYDRWASPACVVVLQRPDYVSDPEPPPPVAASLAYADGLGRVAQHRQAAEPGATGDARWIVSGTTMYTVDGLSAVEYLPYYGAAPGFGYDSPVPPRVLHYDPLRRPVRVDTPKGFFTRTVITPWEQRAFDEDDTVTESAFYAEFMATYPPDPTPRQRAEHDALEKAARFAGTPAVSVLDNAGNPVRRIENALGDITPDLLAPVIAGSDITPTELWDELHRTGYLETTSRTRVTAQFQPYRKGFVLRLDPPYEPFAGAATDLLRQACLTTLAAYDCADRLVLVADPRQFLRGIEAGETCSSVRYAYPMGQAEPALTASADAGARRLLTDSFGRLVTEWDAREVRVARAFDGLDRPLSTVVYESGGSRTVELLTYGEHQPDPAAANLNGHVYRVDDGTGTLLTPEYSITGEAVIAVRRFARDYQVEPDWATDVPLDPGEYRTTARYDALGRLVQRSTPDGAALHLTYHVSGRLATVTGEDPAGGSVRYLVSAGYTAAGGRERTEYGNGAVRTGRYEPTTGRQLELVTSTRDGSEVQRVWYAYDPVGNVTWVCNRTPALVFDPPQPVATGDNTYDGTYRLLRATGAQHPGIDAMTYATGFKQTIFTTLTGSGTRLEAYTEDYRYDDAGNLVALTHSAPISSFTREDPVRPDSNRLAGTDYDGAGNPLALEVYGPVVLTWDGRGRLAHTSPAARPDGGSERTWFGYDAAQARTRTVVQRFDAAGALAETVETRDLNGWTQTLVDGVAAGSRLWLQDDSGPLVEVSGSGQTRYQIGDRLGSVSVELDGTDATVASYEAYFPYGGSAVIAGPVPAAVAAKTYRYTGQQADDSTSLYHFPARYYAPWLSRWLEPDPSGATDGVNLFAYTGGNPLTFLDPSGRGRTPPRQQPEPPRRERHVLLVWILTPSPTVIAFGSGVAYGIANAYWHAFVLAPADLRDRLLGSGEVREAQAQNRAARWEENKLIYVYGIPHAYGIDIERYLPERIAAFLLPQSRPLSTWNLPVSGPLLDRRLRATLAQPETYANTAGYIVGTYLTVGTLLSYARRLGLPGRAGRLLRVVTLPLPFLASYSLGLIGRGRENDQVWARYQSELRRNRERPWYDVRSWDPSPELYALYDAAHGARRTELYTAHQEREAARLGLTGWALVGVVGGLLAARFLGPWFVQRAWPSRSSWTGWARDVTRSAARWSWNWLRTEIASYRHRSGQLALIQQHLARQQVRALARLPQTSTALVPVQPPASTALAVYRPRPTAITPFLPRPTAITPYRPTSRAVVLFGQFGTPASSGWARRSRTLVVLGTAAAAGTGAYLLHRQRANSQAHTSQKPKPPG